MDPLGVYPPACALRHDMKAAILPPSVSDFAAGESLYKPVMETRREGDADDTCVPPGDWFRSGVVSPT